MKPAAKAPEQPKDAPAWSEKDDAELVERFKRSPYGKLRVNGKDEPIDSVDAIKRTLLDAQRGKGANQFVEQTKKEAAEAKKLAEEAKAERELIARARKGDQQALRELGLVPDSEREQLRKEWEALSPEQQDLYRRNHELEQREAQRLAKEKQDAETAAQTKRREATEKALAEARSHMKEILKDVREELSDVELPEIIGAMRALKEKGAKIGRDYTPEQLALFVSQRREAALHGRYAALKPDAALKLALPHLKSLVGTPEGIEMLESVLGVDFELIAGKLSGRRLEKWKAAQQKKALGGEVKKPEPREESTRAPLPMFRF